MKTALEKLEKLIEKNSNQFEVMCEQGHLFYIKSTEEMIATDYKDHECPTCGMRGRSFMPTPEEWADLIDYGDFSKLASKAVEERIETGSLRTTLKNAGWADVEIEFLIDGYSGEQ
jgi:hypothetical protein